MHQLRSDLLRKFARSLRSIAVVARCWQPVLALLDEGRREHIQADAILGPYDPSWGQFGSVSCRFGWVVQLLLVHAGRKGVDKPCWLSLQHFQSHGPQPTGEQSCLREPADWGVNHSPLRTHTHTCISTLLLTDLRPQDHFHCLHQRLRKGQTVDICPPAASFKTLRRCNDPVLQKQQAASEDIEYN